ncbi:transglutaminase domain-containing protein [Halobacteriales archaeon Cl-PHB]
MSTVSSRLPGGLAELVPSLEDFNAMRVLALVATLAFLGAFLRVLNDVVRVAGDPSGFYSLVALTIVGASLLARWLRVVVALAITSLLLALGLSWYIFSLPYDPALTAMLESNLDLLSGQSVLQIRQADVWATSITPAPVFVTWYLAMRRWYASAVAVGGAMLGYLVLTGDAGGTVTLLGVVAGAGMIGFGDLDRRDGSLAGAEYVALVLAVMVVAPSVVMVVPGGGGAAPISVGGGGGGAGTLEANLQQTTGQLELAGDISLSPTVRYSIESPVGTYWQTDSFDRYTGTGWIRTGPTAEYTDDRLAFPPGPSRRVEQTVTVRDSTEAMPAAWRPVSVGPNVAEQTRITDHGGLKPAGSLLENESYTVTSELPEPTETDLRQAGRDYPTDVVDRYTGLPSDTPDRVAERTAEVTANATNPYETASAIETYLESTKEYSLSVDRPDEHVADSFLFEMEQGYCTYYATTMAVMLRTQDIPARVAVGYTTGQQVGDDRYVVRGLDAHAWVEVYVEDVGWVRFDPTPAGPRQEAEQSRVEQARINDEPNVDTNRSRNQTPTPTATATPTPVDATPTATPGVPDVGDVQRGAVDTADDEAAGPTGGDRLPPREQIALGVVVLAGLVAGLRRSGLARRAKRSLYLRWQPRRDPATDVERAHRRLVILMERRHRPRRPDETVREYLDAVGADPRAWQVADIRERARYAADVDESAADQAVQLVDRLRKTPGPKGEEGTGLTGS